MDREKDVEGLLRELDNSDPLSKDLIPEGKSGLVSGIEMETRMLLSYLNFSISLDTTDVNLESAPLEEVLAMMRYIPYREKVVIPILEKAINKVLDDFQVNTFSSHIDHINGDSSFRCNEGGDLFTFVGTAGVKIYYPSGSALGRIFETLAYGIFYDLNGSSFVLSRRV